MGVLRRRSKEEVLTVLDESLLSRAAFAVTFNEEPPTPEVVVVFKDQPDFVFTASLETAAWQIEMAPGEHLLSKARFYVEDFPDILIQLREWTSRVLEEVAPHRPRRADVLREAFEKQIETLPDATEPFSPETADEWKQRLDEMLARMEEIAAEHDLQRGDIAQLREEIERLKNAGEIMPRRAWLRAVASKVFDYIDQKTDLALKTAIETAVRATIGPGSS